MRRDPWWVYAIIIVAMLGAGASFVGHLWLAFNG